MNPERNLGPLAAILFSPPPLTTNSLPVFMNLPILDILCKWNHIHGLLCLASFPQYDVLKVYFTVVPVSTSFFFC